MNAGGTLTLDMLRKMELYNARYGKGPCPYCAWVILHPLGITGYHERGVIVRCPCCQRPFVVVLRALGASMEERI